MPLFYSFDLIKEEEIAELRSTCRLYRHVPTGARLLSISNDDENKVFSINFRTPPPDSTGIAHIMEHAVLCGSAKYPVKEPYIELVKGSLKTFANAFTYPDRTCYPVASQNLQDFYNLIDVYMDAVLHPLIPREVLQQEGWHYELEELDAPLDYKGVVFNEMKGAYSSPDRIMGHHCQAALFPDHPYSVDSGGDPRAIPDLTYAAFKAFHETYYHPSNAFIFFYGDDPVDTRLVRMQAFLEGYDHLDVASEVPLQTRFESPRQLTVPFAASDDPDSHKAQHTLNWMIGELEDPQTSLAVELMAYILIGTSASPLRKALIDSGLGEDLAGIGLEGELRQAFFSTGMKGLAVEADQAVAAGQLEGLIFKTLQDLSFQGISPDTITAAVNTVEFRLRENNTGSFPRGLLLMLRALSTWLYDGDPFTTLAYEVPLQEIKRRLAAGERLFEGLIRQLLLENPHRVSLTLLPDPGLQARLDAEERQRLDQARANMDRKQLEAVLEDTRRLKLRQETPDSPAALATIPSLTLADLERDIRRIPIQTEKMLDSQVLYHDLFTNGVLYLELGFNLRLLPQEYLPLVPLFGRALIEVGTRTQDFVQLSQRIGSTTGGIRPAVFTSPVKGSAQSAAWLLLRGKATLESAGELFAILKDVLLTVQLDNQERFRQMVLEEKADMEASLAPGGHRLVNTRLRSFFDETGWIDEQMGGVSYLFTLRELAYRVEHDWTELLAQLETMRDLLVNRNASLCNVTLDRAGWAQVRPELEAFLSELPAVSPALHQWQPALQPRDEGLTFPAQVNYVGKGGNLYALGYQYDGSIAVILNYLRTTWLWEKVRVQGGAYGGMCSFDHRSGNFSFLSYRDPNLLETLQNYDQAADFLSGLDNSRLTQDELVKTIIGVIGDLDAYQLPDAKGYTSLVRWLANESDADRQQRRDRVLATELADFHLFSQVLADFNAAASVVVLGSPESLQSASQDGLADLQLIKVI
jgi:hypothetical protein